MKIAIHSLTADPTAAWHELSQHQKVVKITAKLPTTEAPSDKVRPTFFPVSAWKDVFVLTLKAILPYIDGTIKYPHQKKKKKIYLPYMFSAVNYT